jgi:hypothetical protein
VYPKAKRFHLGITTGETLILELRKCQEAIISEQYSCRIYLYINMLMEHFKLFSVKIGQELRDSVPEERQALRIGSESNRRK